MMRDQGVESMDEMVETMGLDLIPKNAENPGAMIDVELFPGKSELVASAKGKFGSHLETMKRTYNRNEADVHHDLFFLKDDTPAGTGTKVLNRQASSYRRTS